MGTVVLTNFVKTVFGNKRVSICDVAMSSSYATGGDTLSAAMLKLRAVEFASVESAGGYVFSYDKTNGKLLAYWVGATGTAMAEVTAATNLASVTGIKIMAIGYGTQ